MLWAWGWVNITVGVFVSVCRTHVLTVWRSETRGRVSWDGNSQFFEAFWSKFFFWVCCTCSFVHRQEQPLLHYNSKIWKTSPCIGITKLQSCFYIRKPLENDFWRFAPRQSSLSISRCFVKSERNTLLDVVQIVGKPTISVTSWRLVLAHVNWMLIWRLVELTLADRFISLTHPSYRNMFGFFFSHVLNI